MLYSCFTQVGCSKRNRSTTIAQAIIQFAVQELLKFLGIHAIRESITASAKISRQV